MLPGNPTLKPMHAAAGMLGTEQRRPLPSLCSRICRSQVARFRRRSQGQMLPGNSDRDAQSTHAHLGRSTSTGRPAWSVATPPALSRSRNCFPVSASGATSSHVTASGLYSRRLQCVAGTGCPQMDGGCWCSLVRATATQGRGHWTDTAARRIRARSCTLPPLQRGDQHLFGALHAPAAGAQVSEERAASIQKVLQGFRVLWSLNTAVWCGAASGSHEQRGRLWARHALAATDPRLQ